MLLRICILVLCFSGAVFAQPVEVEAEASGSSREQAVAKAVLSAVQQVNGVSIQSDTVMTQATAQVSNNDGSRVELSAEVRASIQQQGGGVVRSYRILSVEQEGHGSFLARVWVEVERFRPTSPTGDTRRRLIVSEFRDEAGRRTEFGEALRDRLIQYLTQARRFAILDRDSSDAYEREMALLAREAPLVERVRIGQVLGADYMVVGRMRGVGASRSQRTISLTGETIVQTAAYGALDFQVIEIATRQVRWAANVAAANSGNLNSILETMAPRIGQEISQTIYPLRVVRALGPEQIILNQGGVTVVQGSYYRVMLLGEALRDPYTNESLGNVEQEVALVQIHRVDPRLSYARVITGTVPVDGSEMLVRPAPPPAPVTRPASRGTGNSRPRSMFD